VVLRATDTDAGLVVRLNRVTADMATFHAIPEEGEPLLLEDSAQAHGDHVATAVSEAVGRSSRVS
jgi:dTDP-4-amino-4,6-dideoxygalactose transaminase